MGGRLAFENFPRAFNDDGAVSPGAKMYVFEAGSTTPVITYSDPVYAFPQENPIPADASGYFPQVYLKDEGIYKIRITDISGVLLDEADYVPQGQANRRLFETAAAVISDTKLTKVVGSGLIVSTGELIETRQEGFVYKVAEDSATDHHLSTLGPSGDGSDGVKLYVVPTYGPTQQPEYQFEALGPDPTVTTDNSALLQGFIDVVGPAVIQLNDMYSYIAARLDDRQILRGRGRGTGLRTLSGITLNDGTTKIACGLNAKSGLSYICIRDLEIDGNYTGTTDYADEYEEGFNVNDSFTVGTFAGGGITISDGGSWVFPDVVEVHNVYVHDTTRNCFLFTPATGRTTPGLVIASNLHAKNSAIDHLFYCDRGNAQISGLLCEGYARGGMVITSRNQITNLKLTNFVENPNSNSAHSFDFQTEFLVDDRTDTNFGSTLKDVIVDGDLTKINTKNLPYLVQARVDGGDFSGWRVNHTGAIPVSSYVLPYDTRAISNFTVGETVTGGTSGATATVASVDIESTIVTYGTLKFASVTGGPFTKGETITGSTSGTTAIASVKSRPLGLVGVCLTGTSGAPGSIQGGKANDWTCRNVMEAFQPVVTDPRGHGLALLGFKANNWDILYDSDATVTDLALIEFNGAQVKWFNASGWSVQCQDFANGGPSRLFDDRTTSTLSNNTLRDFVRDQSNSSYEAWETDGVATASLNVVENDVSSNLTPTNTARDLAKAKGCTFSDGASNVQGTATFSGNGSSRFFNIDLNTPYKLIGAPGFASVFARSDDARADFSISNLNTTTGSRGQIVIEFTTAPPSGTDNVVFDFKAEI
ncbi:hypothetical protein [Salipiger thiooxidans]|uniref:hypothetical protein n=1 Tax=Salipiger thiooxidans TaxID=282683 RepID=UPI001CD4A31C|nr:hypothetical protein [Salipiger thiooxidans]MCA0846126.1 hypothetical protein [Salipiger thiooxidans]